MINKKLVLALSLSLTMGLSGCAASSSVTIKPTAASEAETSAVQTTEESVAETEGNISEVYVLPRPEGAVEKYSVGAVDARVEGNCKVNGTGNTAYVEGLENENDKMIFDVDIQDGYFYDITVNAEGLGGKKTNYLNVDGEQVGSFTVDDKELKSGVLSRVYLEKGRHEISITKSWGWIHVNSLDFVMSDEMDASLYDIPSTLVDPKADDSAKRLMSYMTDIYGKYMLTGQYVDKGEIDVLVAETDKRPAIWGYDLGAYNSASIAHGSKGTDVDTMIRLHKSNPSIIFTLCWHWRAPDKYLLNTAEQPWYKGFYTEATNIDLTAIMNGEDEEGYNMLLEDIDLISEQLKLLADAGVPILWRPLHEASGGWFWWGAEGPETYKKLYNLLFDRIVNVNGVHNLIWLWNGQNKDWYPGDDVVDIIGEDIYAGNQVATSQASKFFEAKNYTSAKKMIVLSENGCIPDIDLCRRDGAMWGFFAVWNGEFIKTGGVTDEYSEVYTSREILKKMYSSEYAITLDEVPDLSTYEIH